MKTIVPEGYKKTKVGVIPNDWQLYRTDKVLKRVRNSVDVIADEEYKQIGIRSHGKGIFYKETVSGKELGNKSVFWIEPDCFIVNIVFAWEQAIGKTTENEVGMIASHRFPMYKPQANKVDLDYLVYLFKSKRGKYLLELASPGGAGRNKTLGQGEFAELEIALAPFKEQQKIANILTTYDEAIVKQEELIKEKEELKKGLMQKLLSGEVRFDEFSDEWKEVRLEEIASITMGQSPDSSSYNENNIGVPLIQGNADCKNRTTSPRMYTTQKTKECFIGDIIMTVRAPVGAISKSLHNACIGRGVCSIKSKYQNDFLYHYLIGYEEKWSSYSQGSTFTAVNSSDIKNLKIKLPLLQEQQKIAEVLSLAVNEINLLKNELEELKLQKKALMQKLLTGQVRVKV